MRINLERKEERERIAAALLRTTLELAAAHGFSSLGLREVSRAAGIAPTSFYRHFADMEELGLALIETHVGRLVRDIVHVEKPSQGSVAMDVITNRLLTAAVREPELFRFVLAERVGAIASFRKALDGQLVLMARAFARSAANANGPPPDAETVDYVETAEAAVAIVLDGCRRLLDGADLPENRDRVMRQVHRLFSARSQAAVSS